MTQEELKILIRGREKRTLEYKTAWNELPENLFETICAFLNRDGGVIVLGAQDDGSIIDGVNPRAAEQMCKNLANMSNNSQKLNPQFLLQPELVDLTEESGLFTGDVRKVIVLQVPSSSQVHSTAGKIFDRSMDGDYEVRTDAERSAMYLRKSTQYSENTIYPFLSIEQFDSESVQKAKNLIRNMRSDHPWLALNEMDFFKQSNLYRTDYATKQEGFTLAALLLFGKQEVIQSMLPYYKIDAVVRRINTERYDDRLTLFGNLVNAYDEVMAFFAKYLPDKFYMEGDLRVSLRDKLFREVVSNMLIHREYLNPSITMVEIKKHVIVIKNANRPLRSGVVTLQNYEPHPKNPHLANFFVQMGRAEHLGTGVRNIYRYSPLYMGTQPVLSDDDYYRVELKISDELQTLIGEASDNQNDSQNCSQCDVCNLLTIRQNKILELIKGDSQIKVKMIVKMIGKSSSTINRELREINKVISVRWVGSPKIGRWEIENMPTKTHSTVSRPLK